MTLAPEVVAKLAAPLDPTRVKKREGSGGRSLSYLESHDVIRTANDVFGIGGWSYRVDELVCLATEKFIGRDAREGTRTGYRATVTVRVGDTTEYGDVGYGDATEYTNSTVTTHELASKEAVSDAVKRALRNFGDQFGLCLYAKDAPEHNGRNASASTDGGAADRAAVTAPLSQESPAAPTNYASAGSLAWKYGPHAGVAIADTPLDYVIEYAESGTNGFMAGKCKAFLEESGASASDDPDSDVPFMATIDGLGN